MTAGTSEPMTSAPPDAPAQTSFERIAGVLFAPAETFRDIARKPDFVVPLLVLTVVMYLSVALTARHIDWDAAIDQQVEIAKKRNPNVTEEDIRAQAAVGTAAGKVIVWLIPIVMIAGYAIVAGVLLLACRLFGGEGRYGQAFSATIYAWMPMIIAAIIGTIVVVARGGLIDPQMMETLVKSSPAFLVDMKQQPVLHSFLGSLELFSLWRLVLLIFGFAALSRLSRGKTAGIVISLWLILVVIKLGMAALRAGFQS